MKRHYPSRSSQKGSVLVVSLIMLVALVFLASAGAATARVQMLLVRNSALHQKAFETAEAGIAAGLKDPNLGSGTPTTTSTASVDSNSSASITVVQEGQTDIPGGGYSLGGEFAAYHYQISSSGTVNAGTNPAAATHVQGLYLVGPGGH